MKNIWENLSEQIRVWSDSAAEKAVVITRAAASKAEELSKIGKLKMDIYQLRRERGNLYADLGQIAYQSLEGKSKGTLESQSGVDDLRRRIAGLAGKIKEKEDELEQASQFEEPVHDSAPPKEKAAPEREAPAAAPSKEKTTPKKGTPTTKPSKAKAGIKSGATAAKPGGTKKSNGRKKATPAAKKAGPKKTTKDTGTS
ncbi:MAG: hypothetical protein JSU77_01710 [Fidelibacterota bacterium]|nr:MAG: hypothetical protein JSU77_01710 [Candidatus Neomarinimicrobiota bacterium]